MKPIERYLRFVLAHRFLVIAAVFSISLLSIASLSRAVIASELVDLFLGDSPDLPVHQRLQEELGGADLLVVAYTDAEILTERGLARLENISRGIEAIPEVRRVDSLASLQRTRAQGDELVIEPWKDVLSRSSSAAVELSNDPLILGLFLGRDQKSTAVLIELTYDQHRAVEALPGIQKRIVEELVRAGLSEDGIHLAGLIPETVEISEQARFTIGRIFPLTILLLIAIVYLLSSRLWPVVLTVSITLLSVLWTFGFAVLLNRQIHILMVMVPGIMIIVGFSDVIHMYNAYVAALHAGGERAKTLLHSCSEVGTASAFTAVTEFVGFTSLTFVPSPLMRSTGLVLGFGVASTLSLVLTLVPVLLSFLPDRAVLPKVSPAGKSSDRVGPFLDRLAQTMLRIATSHPRSILAVFASLSALALVGSLRLNIDADFVNRLASDNHIRRSREFLRQRFAAPQFVDVHLTASGGSDLLEPKTIQKIATYQSDLAQISGVDRAVSVIDLLRRLDEQLFVPSSDLFAGDRLTRELIAQYLLLFELSGGRGLDRLIDESRRRMKITLRVSHSGVRQVNAVGVRAKELALRILPPEVKAQPTGIGYLLGGWLDFIIEGQRNGLWFSILTTLAMMTLVLRSVRNGLVSMIPNFLPLLFLGGYLGFTTDSVDSDTLVVASIAMGIAVDDTIHYLTRLRHELQGSGSILEALQRTSASTGRAILQAAAVLCIGFSPFALSEYYSTRMMGTLLPMTLLVALLTELLLMPALITVKAARFEGAKA